MSSFSSTSFLPSSNSASKSFFPSKSQSTSPSSAWRPCRRSSPWPTSTARSASRPSSSWWSSAASSISHAINRARGSVARRIAPSGPDRDSHESSSDSSSYDESRQYSIIIPLSVELHYHDYPHGSSPPPDRSSDSSDGTPIGNRSVNNTSPIYTVDSRSALTRTPPPSPNRNNYFSNWFPPKLRAASAPPPPSTAARPRSNFDGPGRRLGSWGQGFGRKLTYWNANPPWKSTQRSLSYTPQSAIVSRSGYSDSSNTIHKANNFPWRSRGFSYTGPTSGYNRSNSFNQLLRPKGILGNNSTQSTGGLPRSVAFANSGTGTGSSASELSEFASRLGEMISETVASSIMGSLNRHYDSVTSDTRVSSEGSNVFIEMNNHFGGPAITGNPESEVQEHFLPRGRTRFRTLFRQLGSAINEHLRTFEGRRVSGLSFDDTAVMPLLDEAIFIQALDTAATKSKLLQVPYIDRSNAS
ncbi:hypothetical protein I302_103153 [Kwoniella bestiolae CBS 10118]|uniref:Uncharacterized protein n=1 Tax=Kwoniella bestiolae CBS 10118 TaxID=1296100 RepID=A0A1B9G7L4_9TREE|nr:hypothetical protein I302_01851 [Kwoniella bestiolae CBS 10118]OCF27016.1 hypothetical protein I302_01851 [Kwoniella bestiolae CBS 10118]